MKWRVTIAAGALAVACAGSACVTAPAVAAARTALAVPVVYGVPYGHVGNNFVHGKVKPTGLMEWTGDNSAWFVIHSWSRWATWNAYGTATVHVRTGQPGFHYRTETTRLHFYRVRIHRGHRYFTRLHFALRHKVAGLGSGTLRFCPRNSLAWYYTC
jgi:hypothetical protein